MNEIEPMSYIGQRPCGCVVMAIVNTPERAKEVAKEVGYCIRHGETVSLVTCEQVRTMSWKCETHKSPLGKTVEGER